MKHGGPALVAMGPSVMRKMAPLAKRGEISRAIVAGILVEMCCGKHDIGLWQGRRGKTDE